MYIAMNRFRVLKDRTGDFENAWFNRDSYLHALPGFIAFHSKAPACPGPSCVTAAPPPGPVTACRSIECGFLLP